VEELTDAESAVVDWLWRRRTSRIRGGTLVDYYETRYDDAHPHPWGRGNHTTGRRHAWRRQGGTILGRLNKKGWLYIAEWPWGVPVYDWTDEARKVLDKDPPV
jgi:hypothetical protein